MKYLGCIANFTILFLVAPSSFAQFPDPPNPSVLYLMKEYNITQEEAQLRISLQEQIIALSERLNADNEPSYADMYIQHEPVYKIIISFADKKDRKAFLEEIDPKIRRYVQFQNTSRSRRDVNAELENLALQFNSSGVKYSGGYNVRNSKYVYKVGSQDEVQLLRGLIPPNLRGDVQIEVGLVESNEVAPVGVKTGDSLVTGRDILRDTASSSAILRCTAGFTVTYDSTKRGILTAAHCPSTAYFFVNNHWVTLSGPVIQRDVNKYDYQIFDTTGLVTDNKLYFSNLNGIPEFPSSGYFRTTGALSSLNQKVGMVVCKSGITTGITCGQIINSNATYENVTGWITVSKSQQSDISAGGDSGSPWFLYPGTSALVTATGVHTAGSGTGPTSTAIYMPIDYIDDHLSSVKVILSP